MTKVNSGPPQAAPAASTAVAAAGTARSFAATRDLCNDGGAIRTDRRAAMTKETGLKLVLAAQSEPSSSAMGPGRRECGRFV